MVQEQVSKSLLQQCGVEWLPRFETDGLIPMMWVGELLLEEPALDGRERQTICHHALFGTGSHAHARHGCQLRDCLVLEKLFGGQSKPCLMSPGDDLNAEDRVAAQLKEIVVDADPLDAENLSPDTCQH